MITEKSIRANLRTVFNRATPEQVRAGMDWYAEEASDVAALAREFGKTPEQVAAAMAHMSPKTPWKRNKAMTRELLATGATRGMSGPIGRAKVALVSDNPLGEMKGPKTSSFARNLVGLHDSVTVDVWAFRAAWPSGDVERMTPAQYRAIASAYEQTAKHYGMTPAQFQAVVWVTIRGAAK